MKNYYYFSIAALVLAGCANDEIVDNGGKDNREVAMSFSVSQKNMTKAGLEETGHYNFGVWAYKNTDVTNAIMANYLVGYMDGTNKKGYKMDGAVQTTLNDSYWAYEKLGTSQYTLATNEPGDFYYTTSDNNYLSNNADQWLKYWDYSSANTEFFAYAPYVKSATAPVEFNNSTKVMTFPDNTIIAGYDNLSLYEYMYAYTNVSKANYNNEVPLSFKRMTSKVNIKFWEDIDGYTVEIVDLKGNTSNSVTGVQATPATATTSGSTTTYVKSSDFYVKAKASVNFSSTSASLTVTGTTKQTDNLEFMIPEFAASAPRTIGTSSTAATPSPTTYYGIPLGTGNNTGFTFHVSYLLTAEDTGEKIYVNNATVHVPASYVQWKSNTHYTYIFKITKSSSGSTDGGATQDYNDPSPSTDDALFPIIFDNCVVEDWQTSDSNHEIN